MLRNTFHNRSEMFFRIFLTLWALAILAPTSAGAQALDREAQRELVSRLTVALRQTYVFPDRIPVMAAELERRVQSEPVDARPFAASLAQALVKVSNDLHFSVAFDPDEAAALRRAEGAGEASTQAQRDRERAANFGFRDARRLDGGLA